MLIIIGFAWRGWQLLLVRTECVGLNRFKTMAETKQMIFDYIEVYYNRQRIHSSIGYMTPSEYEQKLHLDSMQKSA